MKKNSNMFWLILFVLFVMLMLSQAMH